MAKQATATKILAAIIGSASLAVKKSIAPVAYGTQEEFDAACHAAAEHGDIPGCDSVKTYAGNNFRAFEDGSVLVEWEWRKCIAAFAAIEKAVAFCGGDDPRRLYSDFGAVAA